jgi:putative flippase GtrA
MAKAFSEIIKLLMRRDLFFYLVVGGTSAIVNFSAFALFYSFLHFSSEVAVTFSYSLSVIVHFLGNRYLTFKTHGHALLPQLKRYGTMLLVNYALTLLIVRYTVMIFKISPYFGVACAIAATVGLGYLMARFWVFKKELQ